MPKQRPIEIRVAETKRKLKRLDTEFRIRKLKMQLKELKTR